MKKETLSQLLTRMGACGTARAWAKGKSLKHAWATCTRGDWMIWLLTRYDVEQDDRRLRLLACAIAESVLGYSRECDRPALKAAITAARGYAGGTVTEEQLRAAWSAARVAARAARAADAAIAAVVACYAAWNAVDAEDAAWVDACSVADAAWLAARAADWIPVDMAHADIVRRHYPDPPAIRAALEGEK